MMPFLFTNDTYKYMFYIEAARKNALLLQHGVKPDKNNKAERQK